MFTKEERGLYRIIYKYIFLQMFLVNREPKEREWRVAEVGDRVHKQMSARPKLADASPVNVSANSAGRHAVC